ncbi:hypothetical protein VTK73DRAFT_6955 [Phialemonium thermophilum]|uniref:Uncharacterized protein n=1 Tax=Phialemonium thermophilum TaxID=223376 RepID=A0ABR3XTZ4_9PEZI
MPSDHSEWELPRLRASYGFEKDVRDSDEGEGGHEFFDAKFYPYSAPGSLPVFAAISKKHVVVCRLSQPKDKDRNPCEVIRVIRDDDPDAWNCACTWTKDPVTGRPLLCVSGTNAVVKVYDVKEGKAVRALAGHGGDINDLATSPANPQIIASASDDTTVRIWSLAPAHRQQPTLCILGGEGHSWNLLSVAFHNTGRYVLSAGHDQVINLWTLPDLPEEHTDDPIMIHFPHFSTSEVHSGLVDCVAFFGDLILSHACYEEIIVLWRIEGFSSEDPPPTQAQAPTSYDPSKLTRSAFAPVISPACPAQYTRLLEFQASDCGPQFFMRFKLFQSPRHHPVLAFCNAKSKTFFWDFARLTSYFEFMATLNNKDKERSEIIERPPWLHSKSTRRPNNPNRARDPSDKDSRASNGASSDPDSSTVPGVTHDSIHSWDELYDISSPHDHALKPHKVVGVSGEPKFVGRQVAWSPGGEWCVVVGNQNRALIFQRWAKDRGQ